MVDARDRPKATLRALIQYAKDRDRWPSADELHKFRLRLGSLATVKRTLVFLRDRGLAELHGRTGAARWIATDHAFDTLHKPKFVPPAEARRARNDARTLLADHPGSTIPQRTTGVSARSVAAAASDLPVYS